MMVDYDQLTERLLTEVGPEVFAVIARAVKDCSDTPEDAEIEKAVRWCYLILADVFIESAKERMVSTVHDDLMQ